MPRIRAANNLAVIPEPKEKKNVFCFSYIGSEHLVHVCAAGTRGRKCFRGTARLLKTSDGSLYPSPKVVKLLLFPFKVIFNYTSSISFVKVNQLCLPPLPFSLPYSDAEPKSGPMFDSLPAKFIRVERPISLVLCRPLMWARNLFKHALFFRIIWVYRIYTSLAIICKKCLASIASGLTISQLYLVLTNLLH